jgi:hypothetical protein
LLLTAGLAVVIIGLGAGLAGLRGLDARASALERARLDTGQQVRLQTTRTKLVIADTAAGDDVLIGADPTRLSARAFGYALQPALIGLTVAARQDSDAGPLAVANHQLALYVMDVESARTLARQGKSAQAAQTLTSASALLHAQVLPRLQAVQDASRSRLAEDQDAADHGALLALLVALLAVLALAGVHWWLTLRTRRLVNLGLAAGLMLLLAVTAIGLAAVVTSQHRASAVRHGPQHAADGVVEARISAFDARSLEALAVLGGRVPAAETAWQASIASARQALSTAALGAPAPLRQDLAAITKDLGDYAAVHTRLLAQARAGCSDDVTAIAASPTVDGSAGSFQDFDAASGALLARQVQAADDGWAAAGLHLRLVGTLTLLAGLAAAALGWSGLERRRREYR